MKQLAAILLIGILFFNWYGYQLLTAYWQHKADKTLVARLDRNEYSDDQLVSIKVPLKNIEYYNSSTTFERVDGQIELNGVHYNYVKRRIYKGCLELLCIPNTTVTTLQKAKNEFFKQVNDLQQHDQGKKTNGPVKDFSKDYTPSAMDVTMPVAVSVLPKSRALLAAAQLPTCYMPTAERPPDGHVLLS